MVDIKDLEVLERGTDVKPTEAFGLVTASFKKELYSLARERGEITLEQLRERVKTWEVENDIKVNEEELDALYILSQVFGTVAYMLEHGVEARRSMEKAVQTEHDILKTMFANFDAQGKLNGDIAHSFALVKSAVDDFMGEDFLKLKDPGVIREHGWWYSIVSTFTVALLFNQSGWEVFLPPADLDLDNEVDLIVKNPNGAIFTVDVTARDKSKDKTIGEFSDSLFYLRYQKPKNILFSQIDKLTGTIKINLPPIRHPEALVFYDSLETGYPAKEAFIKFNTQLR